MTPAFTRLMDELAKEFDGASAHDIAICKRVWDAAIGEAARQCERLSAEVLKLSPEFRGEDLLSDQCAGCIRKLSVGGK